jgi:hypothetical protein
MKRFHPTFVPDQIRQWMEGEATMSILEQKSKRTKSARRIRLTLAVSTPIAIWLVWLLG